MIRAFVIVGLLCMLVGSRPAFGQTVRLTFAAGAPAHADALSEYRAIWRADGARIVEALERRSTLRFPVPSVAVELIDGASWAGTDRIGMRASYPSDTKRATLVHELGHILIGDRIAEDADGQPIADHHAVLFLFLYDVWTELWGEQFAREQVAVESARRGLVDYEGLWREALERTAAQRAVELHRIVGPPRR